MNLNITDKISDSKFEAAENLQCNFIPARELSGTMIIEPMGVINTYNVARFKERLNIHIKKGYKYLIFDLSSIEYISAVGVGLFIQLLGNIRREEGDIILTGLQKNVDEVFHLPGFSGFFTISSSVSSALELFKDNRNY